MQFLGEALALASAFFFAAGGAAVAKGAVHRGGDNGALLSVILTAASAVLLWTLIGSVGAIAGSGSRIYAGVAWFACAGLLTIFIGRSFLFRSIEHLGAVRATALKRLNPLFSVLLAALILGEPIRGMAGFGMLLIAGSFLMLMRKSLAAFGRPHGAGAPAAGDPPAFAYVFGPASAFSYACGYIGRKFGLDNVPDPYFGTFVSAVAGLVSYGAAAVFLRPYREAFVGLLRHTSRWHVAAGVLVSAGQLSQFVAIQYIEVSRVVMISSAEIVLSMVFAVGVLKTERRPDALTLAAAFLATAGVVLVAVG